VPNVLFPGLRSAGTTASDTPAKLEDSHTKETSVANPKETATTTSDAAEPVGPQRELDNDETEPQLPDAPTDPARTPADQQQTSVQVSLDAQPVNNAAPLPSSPPPVSSTPHPLRKPHLLDVPPGSSSPLSSPPPINFDPYEESESTPSSDASHSDSEESSSVTTPNVSSQTSSASSRATLPVMKGRDLFDAQIWSCPIKTSVFYTFVSTLREKVRSAEPTRSHRFVSVLRDSRKLVRCYTQNIDQLEERVGLSTSLSLGTGSRYRFSMRAGRKSAAAKNGEDPPEASQTSSEQQQDDEAEAVKQGPEQPVSEPTGEPPTNTTDTPAQPAQEQEPSTEDAASQPGPSKQAAPSAPNRGVECVFLHGSLAELRCFVCARTASWDEEDRMTETMAGRQPTCPHCAGATAARQEKGKRALGVGKLRPDIVLYGEEHPQAHLISTLVQHDLSLGPDMLLILGTSLRVHGLKVLVKEFAKAVHDRGGKVVFVNFTKPPESVWSDVIDYWVQWDCDAWVDDLQARKPHLWLPPGTTLPEEDKPKTAKLSRRQSGGETGKRKDAEKPPKKPRESDGSMAVKQEENDSPPQDVEETTQAAEEKVLPLRLTPTKAPPRRPVKPPRERKLNPDAKRPASIRDHKQNGAYLVWSILENLHRITGDGPAQPEGAAESQRKRRGGKTRKSAPAALEVEEPNPERQSQPGAETHPDIKPSPVPSAHPGQAGPVIDPNQSITATVKTRKRKQMVAWRIIGGVETRIMIPTSPVQDQSPRDSAPPNHRAAHRASLPFTGSTFQPSPPIPESRRLPPPTPTTPRGTQRREPPPEHAIPKIAPIRNDPSMRPSAMDMIDAGFRETDRLIAQVHQETLLSRPSSPKSAAAASSQLLPPLQLPRPENSTQPSQTSDQAQHRPRNKPEPLEPKVDSPGPCPSISSNVGSPVTFRSSNPFFYTDPLVGWLGGPPSQGFHNTQHRVLWEHDHRRPEHGNGSRPSWRPLPWQMGQSDHGFGNRAWSTIEHRPSHPEQPWQPSHGQDSNPFHQQPILNGQVHEDLQPRSGCIQVANPPAEPPAKPKAKRKPRAKRQTTTTNNEQPPAPQPPQDNHHEYAPVSHGPSSAPLPQTKDEIRMAAVAEVPTQPPGMKQHLSVEPGRAILQGVKQESDPDPESASTSWCPDEQLREEHEAALTLSFMRGGC
jgi:NAD-dependent SIR2 family protein deacetylase